VRSAPMSTQTTLNHVNRALSAIVNGRYFDAIPLDAIFSAVRNNAGEVLDVDGTPLSGVILCGEEGSSHFSISGIRRQLHLSWYTMPSGRYEVLAYVS
jgi:hypothetical protein